MDDTARESLKPIIQVLKTTAQQFRLFDQEADVALEVKQDKATYQQKLEAKA